MEQLFLENTDVPSHYKDECLGRAASASFIDEGALSLCKGQTDYDKVKSSPDKWWSFLEFKRL